MVQKYTFRDDNFYIYIPVSAPGSRYVLLFQRFSGHGKMGS